MVEQSQFSHEANCKTEQRPIDCAEDPSIRIHAIVADLSPGTEKEGWIREDCYSGGKKNQRLNTVSRRPRRKSAFQLSVRASVRAFTHVDGGNFSLTANTPVNSAGSLTRKAARARCRN